MTPPFPAYTSGHATFSTAAGELLEDFVGSVPFGDRAGLHFGREARAFSSPAEAAVEAAASRVIGGIHYPMDEYAGIDQGRCVARKHDAGIWTRER